MPSAFGHSAPAIAAGLTYQAGCSTFRQRSTYPHPVNCRMRAPSGPQVRRVQVFEVSRRMGVTESTPHSQARAVLAITVSLNAVSLNAVLLNTVLSIDTVLARRDAYMHLTP